jgi:TPR repeat protein
MPTKLKKKKREKTSRIRLGIALTILTAMGGLAMTLGLKGAAAAAEVSGPIIDARQPDPFSSSGGELIEITDLQGRKVVVREKGKNPKEFIKVKGKVIMTRGDDVTIQLEEKDKQVTEGDRVELSFSVEGEVLSVGTWRVSKVKEDGTLEAEMFNKNGPPGIGMDALVYLQEQPEIIGEKGKEDGPVDGVTKPPTDPAVIYADALRYYQGDGVPKDPGKAFGLFKEAGEMGYASAQFYMGWMYNAGEGVQKDPVKAVTWYRKAADQNNASAKNNLGDMHLKGEGVKQDYGMAYNLFREAADGGSEYGYWNLGRVYESGWGVEKNLTTAFSYYLKAAEMGHVNAQDKVGEFYMNGTGVGKDYGKAYEWSKKAADSGFARSYNNLGLMYLYAFGVERDYAKAHAFFEKAAGGGFTWGYFNLGRLYDNGWGVPRDEQKALEYYSKFGDHVSEYKKGAGKGIEEARKWLKKRNMDW